MQIKQKEREVLKSSLQSDMAKLCPILANTIPCGIAYLHAGMTTDERIKIEYAFRKKVICVICCTSTALEASIHLVARRIIIRSPYIGNEFITKHQYKQLEKYTGIEDLCETITIFAKTDHTRIIQILNAPMHLNAKDSLVWLSVRLVSA